MVFSAFRLTIFCTWHGTWLDIMASTGSCLALRSLCSNLDSHSSPGSSWWTVLQAVAGILSPAAGGHQGLCPFLLPAVCSRMGRAQPSIDEPWQCDPTGGCWVWRAKWGPGWSSRDATVPPGECHAQLWLKWCAACTSNFGHMWPFMHASSKSVPTDSNRCMFIQANLRSLLLKSGTHCTYYWFLHRSGVIINWFRLCRHRVLPKYLGKPDFYLILML